MPTEPTRRSWIHEPGDTESPELERITRGYRKQGRRSPSVIAVMTCAPATLKNVLRLHEAVTFGGSKLGRDREELIASTTSALNECFY